MLILIKRLFIDYYKVFLYTIVVSIVWRVSSGLINDAEMVNRMNEIWILIASTGLVLLSTFYLYRFIFSRDKFFYYTLKFDVITTVILLALVFVVLNLVFYSSYINVDNLSISSILMKIISTLTYFMFTVALMLVCRTMINKQRARNMYISLATVFILLAIVLFFVFFDSELDPYAIGVSSSLGAKNIYINIFPVNVLEPNESFNQIAYIAVAINIIWTTISIICIQVIKKHKINW
jgi:membrane protein